MVPLVLRPQAARTMLSWSACTGARTTYRKGGGTSSRELRLRTSPLEPGTLPVPDSADSRSKSGGTGNPASAAALTIPVAVSIAFSTDSPSATTTAAYAFVLPRKISSARRPFSATSTIKPSASSDHLASSSSAKPSSTSSTCCSASFPPKAASINAVDGVRTVDGEHDILGEDCELPDPTQRAIAAISVDASTGLATWSSIPAARQPSRSPYIALAVTAIMGIRSRPLSVSHARISRAACHPSLIGMLQSINMTSGERAIAATTAASPSTACTIRIPLL
mmetsp:Transcript_29469/g.52755  ORF Transcript_29469/g.52755 Transcript_29469/m.52755 type:complete len:280 (+) Transcript_29469:1279-2118(+)